MGRKVEYLRAWTNNTWDTVDVTVPSVDEDPDNGVDFDAEEDDVQADLLDYANAVLTRQPHHADVVLFAIYNSDMGDA